MTAKNTAPATFTGAQVQPYLSFNGRCEEAVEFYRRALNAREVALMRFKDSPDQSGIPPGSENKIMHSSFRVGDTLVMATDGCNSGTMNFEGISLAFSVKTEAEAQLAFSALSDGGQVEMPLTKTFFSPSFGMLKDRFGVHWMIVVSP